MTQDMYDLEGWREVTCEESDAVRARNGGVYSSLTDMDGNYGPPVVFTEWQDVDREPQDRGHDANAVRVRRVDLWVGSGGTQEERPVDEGHDDQGAQDADDHAGEPDETARRGRDTRGQTGDQVERRALFHAHPHRDHQHRDDDSPAGPGEYVLPQQTEPVLHHLVRHPNHTATPLQRFPTKLCA